MDPKNIMDDPVARTRTRLLGMLAVATALTLVAGRTLAPRGIGMLPADLADAAAQISTARNHPDQTLWAGMLLVLASGGVAALFPSLARLATGSGRGFATAAAVVGAAGGMLAALSLSWRYLDVYAAAHSGIASGDAAVILVSTGSSGVAPVAGLAAPIALLAGVVLQGIAFWRGQEVARWVPVLLVGGFVALFASPPGAVASLLAVPFLAAVFYLALLMLRPPSGTPVAAPSLEVESA
jgi:hypothetical protein